MPTSHWNQQAVVSQAEALHSLAGSWQYQLPPTQVRQDFYPALDAQALKNARQMFFHRAFSKAQHLRNALVRQPPQYQREYFSLPGRQVQFGW